MQKSLLLLFIMIISSISAFSAPDVSSDTGVIKMKIGQHIPVQKKFAVVNTVTDSDPDSYRPLWEDTESTASNIEILFYELEPVAGEGFIIKIVFTTFNGGLLENLYFTVPVVSKSGEVGYYKTDPVTVDVEYPLTDQEREAIKNIEEPDSQLLREVKPQEKFRFQPGLFLMVMIIVLVLLAAGAVIFYLLWIHVFRKRKSRDLSSATLPPYQLFLARLEQITIQVSSESRLNIEKKISLLGEAVRELLYGDFKIEAPTETTRELIRHLKKMNFDYETTLKTEVLFEEMDMIKFARAPVDQGHCDELVFKARQLGSTIHDLYMQKLEEQVKEDSDADIQTG
jgi:hypothetical protein